MAHFVHTWTQKKKVVRKAVPKELLKLFLKAQQGEITEYEVYTRLASSIKETPNKNVLDHIAQDEKMHYSLWKRYTQQDIGPKWLNVYAYLAITKLLGLTFGIGLMERKEQCSEIDYKKIHAQVPEIKTIIKNEQRHEKQLLKLIEEERLRYVGSLVLGVNDALVETTGALAGLTLALQDSRLVAVAGLVTGIAASLSMASSEYLSTKAERVRRKPLTASVYTGLIYFTTVLLLVAPFFLLSNVYGSLAWTLLNAVVIIALFTYYISVVQNISYRKRFIEMLVLSGSIAALSFILGFVLRTVLGIAV